MPIRSHVHGDVHVVTVERPERRNAIDHEHLDALDAAVRAAEQGGARALVLTGAQGHFCAGADLTELEDVAFTERLAEVLGHLASLPVTTVAAISGSCMGLGMQLAVACDVRVATDDARYAVPVARLGLMVDHWTLERVARCWGEGAARHMVLTAAVLDADDAWRLGFVQRRGDLDDALELATSAARLAPLTQAGSKTGLDARTPDDLARYRDAFATAWASADLQEGRAAFADRRPPTFEGR
ncbi:MULTISPECIES: enoyl-CoA hydratase-related protein [Janibacter]|uniref:Enoyl-CoA hydratase n=1 Tax=Janibacter melonis TaxID=262209 RepID=A0A176QE76_9MICO|nr:enoyl-CoA hydratase-related protein [Janibacter melonis]MBD5829786.1 enoyl-CoA hydratase [Janibacter melonis]OAB87984.1 enoyl-CoA hydratase [Janibacter melonis]QFQ29880.1 enoyl-CoA hydratase [Janibacter melonis]